MHRPFATSHFAHLTRFADLLFAKPEQAKIHFCPTLPIRGLELKEGSPKECIASKGVRLHRLHVCSNYIFALPVATILANEPWDRKESAVILGDDVPDKVPRRLCVQAMHPPGSESLLHLSQRCPRSVLRNLWIVDDGNHVLETIIPRPSHFAIDRFFLCEGPSHGE